MSANEKRCGQSRRASRKQWQLSWVSGLGLRGWRERLWTEQVSSSGKRKGTEEVGRFCFVSFLELERLASVYWLSGRNQERERQNASLEEE